MQLPNDSALMVLTGRAMDPVSIPCRQFERVLCAQGVPAVDNDSAALRAVGRMLGRLNLIRRVANLGNKTYLVSFMQPSAYRLFPQALWAEVVPLCYDCWPPSYARWHSMFRRLGTRRAFFTARQSASHMAAAGLGLEAMWLPEAIDPGRFDPSIPIASRRIDVLEFGRRWLPYHQAIAGPLRDAGLVHLHETRPNTRIFDTADAFTEALNNARISICFPGSLTHPEYTGGVETLTQRYLESMAAGCLVIGRNLHELDDLFGYSPVIEADLSDPAGQIQSILADPGRFEALRQRNLDHVRRLGSWPIRIQTLLAMVSASTGGSPDP